MCEATGCHVVAGWIRIKRVGRRYDLLCLSDHEVIRTFLIQNNLHLRLKAVPASHHDGLATKYSPVLLDGIGLGLTLTLRSG